MKWFLLLLLVFGVLGIIPITNGVITGPHPQFDSGGGFAGPFFTYSKTMTIQSGQSQTKNNGSTLSSAQWLNPSYVSIYNTYYLQILPNQEYISNNVSFSLSASQIAINVTFLLASSSNSGAFGSLAIGYGTYIPSTFTNAFAPSVPSSGITVYLMKGGMNTYHLFVYFDGVKQLNVSVGSISIGEQIGLGFYYLPASNQLYVYYYNGSVKTFSLTPSQVVGTNVLGVFSNSHEIQKMFVKILE